MECRR